MRSISFVLASMVVAVGLMAVAVNAQCDPTVCCDPSAYQHLPFVPASALDEEDGSGDGSGSSAPVAVFQSCQAQLNLLGTPVQYDPTLAISFNTIYDGIMIDAHSGEQEAVHMMASVKLIDSATWGVQLSLAIGARFNQTSRVYPLDQNAKTGYPALLNNPTDNPNLPPGLLVLFQTDVGNDEHILASNIVPYNLINGTITVQTLFQSLNGPLSRKSCQSLPVWSFGWGGELWYNIYIWVGAAIYPNFTPYNPPVTFCDTTASNTMFNDAPAINFTWNLYGPNKPEEEESRRHHHHPAAPLIDVV